MSKKKARFIADSVRVTTGRCAGIFIEAREARVAKPAMAYVPLDSIPALIEAITKAAIEASAGDRAP